MDLNELLMELKDKIPEEAHKCYSSLKRQRQVMPDISTQGMVLSAYGSGVYFGAGFILDKLTLMGIIKTEFKKAEGGDGTETV